MSFRMRPLIQLIFDLCHTFAECFHEIFREHIQLGRVSFGALHGMPSKPFPCKEKKSKMVKKFFKIILGGGAIGGRSYKITCILNCQ